MRVLTFPNNPTHEQAAIALRDTVTSLMVTIATASDPKEVEAIWQWSQHCEHLMAELVDAAANRMNDLDHDGKLWAV